MGALPSREANEDPASLCYVNCGRRVIFRVPLTPHFFPSQECLAFQQLYYARNHQSAKYNFAVNDVEGMIYDESNNNNNNNKSNQGSNNNDNDNEEESNKGWGPEVDEVDPSVHYYDAGDDLFAGEGSSVEDINDLYDILVRAPTADGRLVNTNAEMCERHEAEQKWRASTREGKKDQQEVSSSEEGGVKPPSTWLCPLAEAVVVRLTPEEEAAQRREYFEKQRSAMAAMKKKQQQLDNVVCLSTMGDASELGEKLKLRTPFPNDSKHSNTTTSAASTPLEQVLDVGKYVLQSHDTTSGEDNNRHPSSSSSHAAMPGAAPPPEDALRELDEVLQDSAVRPQRFRFEDVDDYKDGRVHLVEEDGVLYMFAYRTPRHDVEDSWINSGSDVEAWTLPTSSSPRDTESVPLPALRKRPWVPLTVKPTEDPAACPHHGPDPESCHLHSLLYPSLLKFLVPISPVRVVGVEGPIPAKHPGPPWMQGDDNQQQQQGESSVEETNAAPVLRSIRFVDGAVGEKILNRAVLLGLITYCYRCRDAGLTDVLVRPCWSTATSSNIPLVQLLRELKFRIRCAVAEVDDGITHLKSIIEETDKENNFVQFINNPLYVLKELEPPEKVMYARHGSYVGQREDDAAGRTGFERVMQRAVRSRALLPALMGELPSSGTGTGTETHTTKRISDPLRFKGGISETVRGRFLVLRLTAEAMRAVAYYISQATAPVYAALYNDAKDTAHLLFGGAVRLDGILKEVPSHGGNGDVDGSRNDDGQNGARHHDEQLQVRQRMAPPPVPHGILSGAQEGLLRVTSTTSPRIDKDNNRGRSTQTTLDDGISDLVDDGTLPFSRILCYIATDVHGTSGSHSEETHQRYLSRLPPSFYTKNDGNTSINSTPSDMDELELLQQQEKKAHNHVYTYGPGEFHDGDVLIYDPVVRRYEHLEHVQLWRRARVRSLLGSTRDDGLLNMNNIHEGAYRSLGKNFLAIDDALVKAITAYTQENKEEQGALLEEKLTALLDRVIPIRVGIGELVLRSLQLMVYTKAYEERSDAGWLYAKGSLPVSTGALKSGDEAKAASSSAVTMTANSFVTVGRYCVWSFVLDSQRYYYGCMPKFVQCLRRRRRKKLVQQNTSSSAAAAAATTAAVSPGSLTGAADADGDTPLSVSLGNPPPTAAVAHKESGAIHANTVLHVVPPSRLLMQQTAHHHHHHHHQSTVGQPHHWHHHHPQPITVGPVPSLLVTPSVPQLQNQPLGLNTTPLSSTPLAASRATRAGGPVATYYAVPARQAVPPSCVVVPQTQYYPQQQQQLQQPIQLQRQTLGLVHHSAPAPEIHIQRQQYPPSPSPQWRHHRYQQQPVVQVQQFPGPLNSMMPKSGDAIAVTSPPPCTESSPCISPGPYYNNNNTTNQPAMMNANNNNTNNYSPPWRREYVNVQVPLVQPQHVPQQQQQQNHFDPGANNNCGQYYDYDYHTEFNNNNSHSSSSNNITTYRHNYIAETTSSLSANNATQAMDDNSENVTIDTSTSSLRQVIGKRYRWQPFK